MRLKHRNPGSAVWLCLCMALLMGMGCQKKSDKAGSESTYQIVKTQTGDEMVHISGGWFEMGSETGQADERPVHRVYVSDILMDRTEVTQQHYRRFPLPDPSHFKDPNRPVDQINWTDALDFCNERSLAEGLEPCYDMETLECDFQASGYRLPTEAEWEYACRAGTAGRFSCGDDIGKLQNFAWYKANAPQKTQPVACRQPNAWGLFDMHGNVKEWCHDLYSESYYQNSSDKDPRGPAQGSERVIRGGAWDSSADSCRSAYRSSDASLNDTCLASDAIGFRCVRNAPPANDHDILGSMQITDLGFATLTRRVRDIAKQCCPDRILSGPEGGYHQEGLAASVQARRKALI